VGREERQLALLGIEALEGVHNRGHRRQLVVRVAGKIM
jgi:hypothetical protein